MLFLREQNISSWVLEVCLAYFPPANLCLPTLQAAVSWGDAQDVWFQWQGICCALICPAQLSADSCGQEPWWAQSSQTTQLRTAGAHSISQSCGVLTSQLGTVLLADTYKAGEITLTEVCF